MLAGSMRQRTLSIALALLLLVTQHLGLLHLLSHLAPPAGPVVVHGVADPAPAHADAIASDAADAMCQACLVLATLGVATLPALLRQRLQLAGERRGLGGRFSTVSAQASHTRYRHEEVEGSSAVGTTFRSRGHELRLQATPAASTLLGGTLRGMLGLQTEQLDFPALGEEAFVPGTQSRHQALFTPWRRSRVPGVAACSSRMRPARTACRPATWPRLHRR
jgi:hypothetical protein